MCLLSLKNVYSGYGNGTVLQDINLYVKKNEFVVVIGPNGSGKTTLLETIFRVTSLYKGTINFNNDDISNEAPEFLGGKGIAYVKQRNNIFPTMTVLDNLKTSSLYNSCSYNIKDVYNYFPILKERKNQIAGTLSGGERQMLAIGCALMSRADLLLLDEPSGGLAPKVVKDLFNIIRDIHKNGISIFLVEQNSRLALENADRGYVLEGGKIRLSGTTQYLIKNDTVAKHYLGLN